MRGNFDDLVGSEVMFNDMAGTRIEGVVIGWMIVSGGPMERCKLLVMVNEKYPKRMLNVDVEICKVIYEYSESFEEDYDA